MKARRWTLAPVHADRDVDALRNPGQSPPVPAIAPSANCSTPKSRFLSHSTRERTFTGITNLEARTQRNFEEMLGLFVLSLLTDDLTIPLRRERHQPSWNVYDIFRGLNEDLPITFPHRYPLIGYNATFGSFFADVSEVRGGSATFFLITGTPTSRQLLDLHGYLGGPAAPESLRVAIVRLQ